MGLISSLANAVSSLNVNQQNLNILSQNIANANTDGYSAQIVKQQASFINGLPQGVSIASITRKVNEFVTAEVRNQTTTNSANSTIESYYQQIENLLGQPGDTNSMDQNISAFFTAVQNMANSPSTSAQTTVVNAANTLASQISSLADSAQKLRLQADTELYNDVNAVNTDLKKLHEQNILLEKAYATHENQSGLLDERDALLKDLAQYMDINVLAADDGSVSVSTTSGTTLVGSNLVQLSYTPVASTQTFINQGTLSALQATSYDDEGSAVGKPTTLVSEGISGTNGTIQSALSNGSMSALISVRDKLMPDILDQLDQLAASLRDQVNSINNAGVSFPPATSYTGERLVSGTQVSQYSGSLRIALLNPDGTPIASSYPDEPNGQQPLTLDLSTLDTGDGAGKLSVDGLVNIINQYFGQPQPKLELGNLNNIQLALDSDSVPANGNLMSFDFSLNNISNDSAKFFVTGATVQDSNGITLASPTLNVPSLALASTNTFQTTAGSNLLTITSATNQVPAAGDMIYLPPVSPATNVGGLSTASLTGYFKVTSVSGNTFQIEAPAAASATSSLSTSGLSAITNYATASAGSTIRTGSNGVITADLSANSTSPYYTVTANVATIDKDGNVQTSTVTYRVGASTAGARNDLFGVESATGGTIVTPTSNGAQITASLVDANGNALTKPNGVYGSKQGYLKIASTNGVSTVAIDSLDSKELGTPSPSGTIGGTNQGFSQYFGLNNFFKANSPTSTGDALANSAINLAVESRIKSNPTLISVGKLVLGNQPADGTQSANYTYRVNSGDNSISQALAALSTASVGFSSAGGLPAIGTTLSQYSGLIIAQTSTNLKNATSASENSQTLLNGFDKQAQNVSGVNLDQELANTVIYQNSYSASTRVITVVSQLFQDLLGVIR